MSRMSQWIRTLCLVSFASVAASTLVPALSHAADAPTSATLLPAGAVALVNGQVISQSALDDAVRQTGAPDTPQLRATLKEGLVARELVRQQAVRDHYDQRPEVVQAADADKVNVENRAWIEDNVQAPKVTESAVKARYAAVNATLGKEQYKAQMLAAADLASANTVIAGLKAGQPFASLVQQYGVGPTKVDGGEMPWVSLKLPLTEGKTNGVPMPIAQLLTTLQPGETAPQPLQAGDKWLVVRLEGKRPTQVPTLDETKDIIRRTLQDEGMQAALSQRVAELARNATIVE